MNKELFQAYFESAPDYVLQVDATGRILSINRTYRGLSVEDVIGSSVFDWVPEEFREQVKTALERVLRTAEPEVVEYWAINADGEKRWHSAHFGAIRGGGGRRTAIAIVRDITPRIEAEEALKESERRYRSLFDECPIALWEVDASRVRAYIDQLRAGGIQDPGEYFRAHPEEAAQCIDLIQAVDANKAAVGLYKAVDKEAFLRDLRKILVDSPYDAIKEELMAITKGASLFEREALHQTFQGERKHVLCRFSVAPGYEKTFGRILVSVIDLTGHRRMQEELEKVERLESLGVLAGGIAHDFNNLLTAILANISMVRLYGDPKDDIAEMLTDAEKASLRAKRLTQQLLAFSRGGAPNKKTLSIGRVIRETTDFALSGSRAHHTFSLPGDLWPVEADEGQIAQVVQNLVINADQAMPGGGTLAVSGQNVILGDRDLPLGKGGRYVKISFRDQGTGVADKHLPKIFDPFFTTKQKGSGLGLATSFSIVKNHGGHIRVDSQAGVGTTFHVYLPASDKTLDREESKDDERRATFGGKILLIDDEQMIRKSASAVLGRLGFEVESAKDGSEGIRLHEEAMKAERPFDAVIMDLTIPGGMSGEETLRELKRIYPEVKVVVSSGYSNDSILSLYREYGFSAAVPKPWSLEELTDTLRRLIGPARGGPASGPDPSAPSGGRS